MNVGRSVRNLWRPVIGVGMSSVTFLLVGGVLVGRAYAETWLGLAAFIVGMVGLAFMVWRCFTATATVERGDTLAFVSLLGRREVPLYVARNGVIEVLGDRLAGLRLGATPFFRQPLALAPPNGWERLLGPDVAREISLWRALRRGSD